MKVNILLLVTLLFVGCSNKSRIVFPNKGYEGTQWSIQDKGKNIAIQHLARTKYTSTHLIRLKDREQPHFHDYHDLTVTIISGESIMHFRDHEVLVKKGDVIHIPSGTYHWAENIDDEASVAVATFSPPYRGKDKRLADKPMYELGKK